MYTYRMRSSSYVTTMPVSSYLPDRSPGHFDSKLSLATPLSQMSAIRALVWRLLVVTYATER